MYVTLTGDEVRFSNVSFGLPNPVVAGLAIPATLGRFQANVVPAVEDCGV